MAHTDDPTKAEALPSEEPAGKVEFDARGKAVWRWARDLLDSTSILLKRLDNKQLALEPTQKVPIARTKPAGDATPVREPKSRIELSLSGPASRDGGGFDPYNSG
jgi:hypothetical protein